MQTTVFLYRFFVVELLFMLHPTMVDHTTTIGVNLATTTRVGMDPTTTIRVDQATTIRVGMYPTPTRLPPKNMYKAQ